MQNPKIGHAETVAILLAEGFVSVSLQVFIIRQIVPFSGSNVSITSLIIGIFLACLAVGYRIGGSWKDNHLKILHRNLLISALVISIGFSYPVMELFMDGIFKEHIGNTLISTAVYLLIFLTPPVFLLGQTMPLLTNFLKKQNVSKTTGLALSINTIGSVLGSVGTTLILMHYFGMSVTLIINVSLLCLIGLYLNKKSIIGYTIAIASIGSAYLLSTVNEDIILTNEFANYQVIESENQQNRYLVINKSLASGVMNNKLPFEYAVEMRKMMSGLGIKKKEILVLGAGGFTISMGDRVNNYTFVDIDPALKAIAEDYFLKRQINGKTVFQDARLYLKENSTKYDIIVVDLFTHRASMPWHVSTKEFMDLLNSRIKDEGYAMFNIISKKDFADDYSQRIDNTISNSLGLCYKNPVFTKGTDFVNLIYACKTKQSHDKQEVYIDNKLDVEIDLAKSSV